MTEYSLLIAVALFLVVAVIAYKIIKGLLKTALVLVAVASIVLGAGVFLVYMDANKLKENFGSEKNLFLLVDNNEVLSALEFDGESDPQIINQQELDEYSRNLREGGYAKILDGYYKLFILDIAILDAEAMEDKKISADVFREGNTDEKAELFASIVSEVFSNTVFLISEYKEGNILVYEETIMFKAIRMVPTALIKTVANKLIDRTKSMVDKIDV